MTGWGRGRWALVVVGLWLLATVVFSLLASGIVTPRRAQDEFLFWALAQSLADGLGLQWRGAEASLVSSLYPAFASVAVRLVDSVSAQFELVKVMNAAAMSAVIFPTYLLARAIVDRPRALLAAVFAISVPAMNYVAMIETEALAYPLCAAALAALVVLTATPGARVTVIFLALAALAALTRIQFVILLPIAIATPLVAVALRERGTRAAYLRSQRSLFLLLGACLLLAIVYVAVRGRGALGIYVGVLDTGVFAFGDIGYWLRAYAADVYLMAAFVPTVATFALLGRQTRRDPLTAALAVVALVATVAFVVQVTALSATNAEYWIERHVLYERYLFYLSPLYFTGLLVAVGRITLRAASISTLIGLLIVLAMPAGSIMVPYSLDAFGQAYLGYLIDAYSTIEGAVAPFLAALSLLAGAALIASTTSDPQSVPARWGRALALLLPLFALGLTQAKAWSYQQLYASDSRAQLPVTLEWASQATDRRVAQLVATGTDRTVLHQTEFWNPNVDRIYISETPPIDSPKTTHPYCNLAWDKSGRVLPAPEPGCASPPSAWLVQSAIFSLQLRDQIHRVSPRGQTPSTLTLVDGPPRFLSMLGGRNVESGRVVQPLELRTFLRSPGEVRVTVVGRSTPLTVDLSAGERFTQLDLVGRTVTSVELREGSGPWRSIL